MSTGKIILTTVITTLAALVFSAVAAVSLLPFGAEAHGGFRGHMGGGDNQDRHARALKHCERLSPAHTRVVQAAITAGLDLDDSQEAALAPVIDVLDNWRSTMSDTCGELANGDMQHDVDTGLALMERVLSDSASAISELRPAYAEFSAQLNDEQQAHIQNMLQRHHGR